MRDARLAMASADYDRVESLCQTILSREANNPSALLLAGEAATKLGKFESALDFYLAIPESDSKEFLVATFSAAEVARELGRFDRAEKLYRRLLQRDPENVDAHERLAFILDLEGRRWESLPYLLEVIRHDRISYSLLLRLGSRDSAVNIPQQLEKFLQAAPHSAQAVLSQAVSEKQARRKQELLNEAINRDTQLIEAHARLGRLLSDHHLARIPDWERALPPEADSHPEIWTIRGLWAQHVGQKQAAIRCFGEAALRDPNQRIAQYQLGQLLSDAGQNERGAKFAKRSVLLQRLAAQMSEVTLNSTNVNAMQEASDVLEQLGRYWEAYGWCGLILTIDPAQQTVLNRMQTLHQRLHPELPLTDPSANPARELGVTSFPLPIWPKPSPSSESSPSEILTDRNVRFVNRTAEMGIDFTYFNSDDPSTEGTRMYEFSGGGVGVLDYDRDGYPDLYLTQGCPWPPKTESMVHQDKLFRNLGNGRFMDVTTQAGLGDGWFSQGVAVGDYDSDGYPDLYIANIGRNRLYRNLGNGTFEDATVEGNLIGREWTTSCLMADLDGDTFPDLYDVNYLKGEDLFDRLCLIGGRMRTCVPGVFDSERDHIHFNSGDGAFNEITGNQAEFLEPARAGLGIVASDIQGAGRLNLFVANDVVANAYLINESSPSTDGFQMRENALLSGLAFDRHGRAQACMGVAADDADGNGLLDFFVTNYYEESNALYLQSAPGLFVESARAAGLYQPSYRQLGFGTQFLDADLDGWVDLVVANGHLDDFTYMNIPYRMPPQFFLNRGKGKFQQLDANTVGPYFEKKLLGRSMALLDWNRDGRMDFAVSHLETPIAVLTNETESAGNWLKLSLVGVDSNRDALGARVTVECDGQTWTRFRKAGDGYQASNEPILVFGLGDNTTVDRLTIHWPSDKKHEFENLNVNQEFLMIENHNQLLEIP